MPTVSELIHSSFRLTGIIAAGETLETAEANDAFVSLNQMVATWNLEGASLVGRKPVTQALTTATQSYALAARPVKIESASVSAGGTDHPLEIVDSMGWEQIGEKGALAIVTRKLYCDYQYPTATVYLWPAPRTTGTLEMWTLATITAFASLAATVDLPPGYEMALRYNFALAIGPEYGRPADPAVVALAQSYKQSIVQLNAQNHMRTPPPQANPLPSQTGVAS